MRRAITIAGLILALGVLGPVGALAKAGGTDRPLKGTLSGYDTANMVTGQVHVVLTGHATHLGLERFVEDGQVIPTGPGTFSWNSTWVATAANGDKVFGGCTGTVTSPDSVHFTLLLNCTGSAGTGRFKGGSASFAVTIHSTRVSIDGVIGTQVVEASFRGTVSY